MILLDAASELNNCHSMGHPNFRWYFGQSYTSSFQITTRAVPLTCRYILHSSIGCPWSGWPASASPSPSECRCVTIQFRSRPTISPSIKVSLARFASSFNITYRNRKWNATRHAFYRSITFYVHYNLLNGVFLDNFIFFGGIYRVVAKCLT